MLPLITAPSYPTLPPFVMKGVLLLTRVHFYWKYHRSAEELYKESYPFHKLAAGHTLSWFVGNNQLVCLAAQVVLVTRRLMDYLHQQNRFFRSYKEWNKAITFRYRPPTFLRSKGWADRWIPGLLRLRIGSYKLACRLKRLAVTTFYLVKEAFLFSMRALDLMEALVLDQSEKKKSLSHLFLHTSHLLNQLMENRHFLAEELRTHKPTVQSLLNQVGAMYTVDELVKALEGSTATIERVQAIKRRIPERVAEVAKDSLYTLCFACFGKAPSILLPRKILANSCTPLS